MRCEGLEPGGELVKVGVLFQFCVGIKISPSNVTRNTSGERKASIDLYCT
jgi:hypothetical protein